MTDLLKKITRRTTSTTVFERGTRRILVTLEPGDCIGFRAERTRRTYRARILDLYELVQCWELTKARKAYEARVKAFIKAGHTRRAAKRLAREKN